MSWLFAFFFASGLCSLIYQVIWLRVAMARFGVTTPLVSIVLSVFMAGLALGSWGAGRWTRRLRGRSAAAGLRLYAAVELAIGVSGLVVAPFLVWGGRLLFGAGRATAWDSASHYVLSGAWVALALLPFCAAMGATFPLAMAAIRSGFPPASGRSFSYLYLANVLGAMTGTVLSAYVLIELLGLRGTLLVTAALNAAIAAGALALSRRLKPGDTAPGADPGRSAARESAGEGGTGRPGAVPGAASLALLFTTGLSSLAMEVVWARQYVPFQGTVVYAFAAILAVYLAATAIGSRIYRRWSAGRGGRVDGAVTDAALLAGVCGLLPLVGTDPRLLPPTSLWFGLLRVIIGIAPFCAFLGFLTPLLVDRWSGGDPDRAGTAYAVNTIGCILGPLLSGFLILPLVGERVTLILLAAPLFLYGILSFPAWQRGGAEVASAVDPGHRAAGPAVVRAAAFRRRVSIALRVAAAAAVILLVAATRDFETVFPQRVVRRDYTASVIATGEGMAKQLLVNGQGVTGLTPITKMMAHLPLACLDRPPRDGLVLCFGMGTSFRSMLSWGVSTTAVELVPNVPPLLGYFHADGAFLLRSPLAHVVIDDARRFLERTSRSFDVITVDPPPPVEAAGSSLLYSREFYETARRRLRPGGMLQQWLPQGEPGVVVAMVRALAANFPHVRVFGSVEGWGFHFLASDQPFPALSSSELAARLPAAATRDLLEWGPEATAEAQFRVVVQREIPVPALLRAVPSAPVLTDDRPVNEYYVLRRTFAKPARPAGPAGGAR